MLPVDLLTTIFCCHLHVGLRFCGCFLEVYGDAVGAGIRSDVGTLDFKSPRTSVDRVAGIGSIVET